MDENKTIVYIAARGSEVLFVSEDYEKVSSYAEMENERALHETADDMDIDLNEENSSELERVRLQCDIDYGTVDISEAIDISDYITDDNEKTNNDEIDDDEGDEEEETITVSFESGDMQNISIDDIFEKLDESDDYLDEDFE